MASGHEACGVGRLRVRVRTGTAGETVFTVLYAAALVALIAAL